MVQVQICMELNVDLKKPELIPGAFRGKVVLNTAHGERVELYDFKGSGSVEEAQAMGLAWVLANMLEYNNPSCRPLRYSKPQEDIRCPREDYDEEPFVQRRAG